MYANAPWEWMGPPAWGGWWIFPLLMMILMIAACVFLMSRMMGGHRPGSVSRSALQVLSERFAKGEISKEEFEEKRNILARPL